MLLKTYTCIIFIPFSKQKYVNFTFCIMDPFFCPWVIDIFLVSQDSFKIWAVFLLWKENKAANWLFVVIRLIKTETENPSLCPRSVIRWLKGEGCGFLVSLSSVVKWHALIFISMSDTLKQVSQDFQTLCGEEQWLAFVWFDCSFRWDMCSAVMMEPVSEGRTGPWPGDLRAKVADLDWMLINIRIWGHLIIDVLEFLVESIAFADILFKPQLLHL